MHWDRPAHILSLLCKHDNANWHYCTNQATHTKSKTVVCNKLQPSSQSPYAPHPRSLDLYWKNKEPGGSMAGLPQPLARAGCPSLWQPRGTGLLGAQGEGVEGGNGVTIHFLVRPAPVGALCPACSRKPSLEMCWLTAAWFLASWQCFSGLPKTLLLFPASEGPLLSPFSTQKSKENPKCSG